MKKKYKDILDREFKNACISQESINDDVITFTEVLSFWYPKGTKVVYPLK